MLLGTVALLVISSLIVDLISSLVVGDRFIVFWFGSFITVWNWYVAGIRNSFIVSTIVLKNVLNSVWIKRNYL